MEKKKQKKEKREKLKLAKNFKIVITFFFFFFSSNISFFFFFLIIILLLFLFLKKSIEYHQKQREEELAQDLVIIRNNQNELENEAKNKMIRHREYLEIVEKGQKLHDEAKQIMKQQERFEEETRFKETEKFFLLFQNLNLDIILLKRIDGNKKNKGE